MSHECVETYTFAIVRDNELAATKEQLLGCVTLFRKGVAGYFSFWVGAEHQGQGVGTRAARLANRVAHSELGLRHLFTAAFRCNEVSKHVLTRAGWTLLPFRGEPPSEDLVFLHHQTTAGAAPTQTRLHAMLCLLLRDVGSDFVVSPMFASTPGAADEAGGKNPTQEGG
jgi:RimJ/RimL family protein N-acetyltransferase